MNSDTKTLGDSVLENREEARRAWACRTLGIAAETPPADLPAAIYERLENLDFVPADEEREAVAILCGEETATPAFVREREEALRGRVEEFAESFFDRPPDERRREWRRLRRECASVPQLRSFLERLDPELCTVVPSSRPPGPLGTLIDGIVRAFVRRPPEAARIRRETLAALRRQRVRCARVVRELDRRFPQIAALDPEFVEEVIRDRRRQRRLHRARHRRRYVRRNAGDKYDSLLTWLSIVVGLVIGILEVVADSNDDESRKTPAKPDYFLEMPDLEMPDFSQRRFGTVDAQDITPRLPENRPPTKDELAQYVRFMKRNVFSVPDRGLEIADELDRLLREEPPPSTNAEGQPQSPPSANAGEIRNGRVLELVSELRDVMKDSRLEQARNTTRILQGREPRGGDEP